MAREESRKLPIALAIDRHLSELGELQPSRLNAQRHRLMNYP
jgi:hypothetical protein